MNAIASPPGPDDDRTVEPSRRNPGARCRGSVRGAGVGGPGRRRSRPRRNRKLAAEPPREIAFGLGWSDLTRALDFPRDGDDAEGFRALKAALRHHSLARMLQAAEDVLELPLPQEGVYMEDATVDAADPDDWRRFIAENAARVSPA